MVFILSQLHGILDFTSFTIWLTAVSFHFVGMVGSFRAIGKGGGGGGWISMMICQTRTNMSLFRDGQSDVERALVSATACNGAGQV